nr:MAG TPA: hypothetical protein [Caudoviricetes sp.]
MRWRRSRAGALPWPYTSGTAWAGTGWSGWRR